MTASSTPVISVNGAVPSSDPSPTRVISPGTSGSPIPSSPSTSIDATPSRTPVSVNASPQPTVTIMSPTPSLPPFPFITNISSIKPSPSGSLSPLSSDGSANDLLPDGGDRNSTDILDGFSACFPASSLVKLENGNVIRMEELQIGDRVEVATGQSSQVMLFTHANSVVLSPFVRLTTSSGKQISASGGHFLYCNGVLTRAQDVKVGDWLTEEGNGTVSKVEWSRERGLFNPQTVSGDIVVNGVKASCYTDSIIPGAAHALLTIFRALGRMLPVWFLELIGRRVEVIADCWQR